MKLEVMHALFNEQQERIYKEALKQANGFECFEVGGLIFKGTKWAAAVTYAHNNPTGGDFYVWLQQHYKPIGQTLTPSK